MKLLLYMFALIMVVVWAIGLFFYAVGGINHLLLVLAAISILINLIDYREISMHHLEASKWKE